MLTDLRLALATLLMPISWVIALGALGATAASIGAIAWALWHYMPALGVVDMRWLQNVLGGIGAVMTLVAGWFCFPAFATALIGLFSDLLATRIEATYYPDLPPAHPAGWFDQFRASLRLFFRALGINLLVLPLYFIPLLNLFIYFIVNAPLLGREMFLSIALRRLSLENAQSLYRETRQTVWATGAVISLLFIIPGVNLLAPILAVSLTIHRLFRHKDAPMRLMLALAPSNMLPKSDADRQHQQL